tara:strand:- start:115 stop:384 length:270 start_codon:yes stop_codon:yes gene_type:complete
LETKKKKKNNQHVEVTEEMLDKEDEYIVEILGHLIRGEALPRDLRPYFRQPFMLFAFKLKNEMRRNSQGLDQAEVVAREWVTAERAAQA